VKVVVADDHAMVRDGLRAVLERAGVQVVGEAADGHEALAEARRARPDVVVMDVGMPLLNGIDATRKLTSELPDTKVVALSMNADRRYVSAMLSAGAAGYVLKNSASEELLTALERVTRGERYVTPGLVADAEQKAAQGKAPRRSGSERPLSAREREVLQLIAEGKSSKEIAAKLGIAVTTVETHRRQVTEKLKLRTIAELTKYAIRTGITSGER
jgi:DNA-binding NarL/FixJ family response regulator